MARAALQRRLTWQLTTLVERIDETPTVRSLVLDAPDWQGHRAGQHVDVRLTADDGYQTQRSYSIASPPGAEHLVITVERLENGEVSPYLVDDLQVGDRLELRGPVGGFFVWEPEDGGPLLLVGGGSGVVPLMAMLRLRAAQNSAVPARLLDSARSLDQLIYRDELERLAARGDGFELVTTLTREQPPGWEGYRRRIDRDILATVAWPPEQMPRVYICGPTPLVESVAESLVGLGHPPDSIRTERFGPTGG